jgi:hypothetical protein
MNYIKKLKSYFKVSNWSNENVKIGPCQLITFYKKKIQVVSSPTTLHMHTFRFNA